MRKPRVTIRTAVHCTYPFLHALLFSSWSRIMPTMISSETSPPASMIFLASTPNDVFFVTCSRSISPVARWQTQNSSRIRGACVPLPIHTTNTQHQQMKEKKTDAPQSRDEKRRRESTRRHPWAAHPPAPGGPMRMVRSCCAGDGAGFFDAAFASSSSILTVSWLTRDLR